MTSSLLIPILPGYRVTETWTSVSSPLVTGGGPSMDLRPGLGSYVSSEAPDSQAWYWTPEWQAGEREAEADYSAGRSQVFASGEDFMAHLEGLASEPRGR